jgi:hypothetical protein
MQVTAIVKYSPRKFDPEAYMLLMFLMYARAPRKAAPDENGVFGLGEIGEVRLHDQRLERETPYSVCTGIRCWNLRPTRAVFQWVAEFISSVCRELMSWLSDGIFLFTFTAILAV